MLKSLLCAIVAALLLAASLPAPAAAHVLPGRYQAPLPVVAYIAGAALAVAMSVAFVMLPFAAQGTPARPLGA